MSEVIDMKPDLRFPEFSGEWEILKLGDVGPVSMCKRIFKDETKPFGDVPFYKIGTFGREPDAFISQEKFEEYKDRFSFPNKGDVLISAAGTIGRTVVYDGRPAYFQDSNIVWIANDEKIILNSFLAYCYDNIRWTTEDTTIARLYNDNLKSKTLASPNLVEQKKIASFLSSVDRKIEQLGKKKSLLEQYKKGMMQKLFSQELRFKDAQGNDFPDWEEKRLGDVYDVNPKASNLPHDFIYIDLESVVRGSLVKESTIKKIGAPSRAQRLLKKGDVLFQTVRPYQKNNYYFDKEGDYVASTGYAQLRAGGSAKFLYQILHTNSFVNKVLARCTGTSYPAINSNDLAKIHFAIPTVPEQQKIANLLTSVDRKIDLVSTELDHAKSFKKGLLQQMFI